MTVFAICALPVKTVKDLVAVSIVSIRSIALLIESLRISKALATIAIEAIELATSSTDFLADLEGSSTPDLI